MTKMIRLKSRINRVSIGLLWLLDRVSVRSDWVLRRTHLGHLSGIKHLIGLMKINPNKYDNWKSIICLALVKVCRKTRKIFSWLVNHLLYSATAPNFKSKTYPACNKAKKHSTYSQATRVNANYLMKIPKIYKMPQHSKATISY